MGLPATYRLSGRYEADDDIRFEREIEVLLKLTRASAALEVLAALWDEIERLPPKKEG